MKRTTNSTISIPIKVQVDNVGAIWLANNSSVSERTKYVDLRAHFVRDMIKDQVIEINFVKSVENDSDIMTKNQQGQHYIHAKSKLVYTVQEINEKKAIKTQVAEVIAGCHKQPLGVIGEACYYNSLKLFHLKDEGKGML